MHDLFSRHPLRFLAFLGSRLFGLLRGVVLVKFLDLRGRPSTVRNVWGFTMNFWPDDPLKMQVSGLHEFDDVKFLDHLGQAPGTVAVDVGANMGFITLFVARNFSRVVSFEPNPFTRERLRDNLAANPEIEQRVTVEPLAVSSSEGTTTLHFAEGFEGHAWASLIEEEGLSAQKVEMTTLDAYVARHGLPRLDFVKIDVEGHEHDVCVGMIGAVRRFHPVILLEINLSRIVLTERGYLDLIDWVDDVDYDAFKIENFAFQPYTWASERVFNLWLLPKAGLNEHADAFRRAAHAR